MSNKLPWFTHDHDARNDLFISQAEDRFGPFGYCAYFKLLEVIHEHGVGDKLVMTRGRLCKELRTRGPQLVAYLEWAQAWEQDPNKDPKLTYKIVPQLVDNLGIAVDKSRQGDLKLDCSPGTVGLLSDFRSPSAGSSSDQVELQIKNFRIRQSKLKSNIPSTFHQPSVNLPIHKKEKEKYTHTAGAVDNSRMKDLYDQKVRALVGQKGLESAADERQLLAMRMPFGGFKDRLIEEIPADRCRWLLTEWKGRQRLSHKLRRALELNVRLYDNDTKR